MPALTIDMIRENPWSVITHILPHNPSPVLIELACLAADYCRRSEYVVMMAARDGSYKPPGWEPGIDQPDVHEESEARSCNADRRLLEICRQFEIEFD